MRICKLLLFLILTTLSQGRNPDSDYWHFETTLYFVISNYCVVFISADSSTESCDVIHNVYCYEYFSQPSNWGDANTSCVDWGGELISLYTQTQFQFLSDLLSNNTVWTSANNLETENYTLVWANGSEVDLLPEGTNLTEFVCGYVTLSDEFNVSSCNITRDYICSKEG